MERHVALAGQGCLEQVVGHCCRGHHLWVSEESHGEIPGRVVLLPCESFLLPMQEPNGILLNSGDPGQENVKLEQ